MGKLNIYLTGKLEGDKNIENFNNDFKDSKKALVFLMAEWCGHCKTVKSFLEPIYEKYDGKEFNGGNVVIGAFHEDEYAQLNSNIDTNITGFPTIKQYTNGSNEEMANTLDRSTQEGIEKYIDMMINQVKSVGQERPEEDERSDEEIHMKPKRKLKRRRTKCKKKKKKIQRQKSKLTKQKKKIKYLENLLTRGRRRRKYKRSVKKSGTSKLKKRRTKSTYNKNESKRGRRSKSSIKNRKKKNKLNFLKRLSSLIK